MKLPIALGIISFLLALESLMVNERVDVRDTDAHPILSAPDSSVLSPDSLDNALVYSQYCGWVRLKHGRYQIHIPDSLDISMHYIRKFENVDLDGDGRKGAIGSLSVNTGGSGCFVSLVVFRNSLGSARHAASYEIGDRANFDSLIVRGDTLKVLFIVHGPGDAACCPSHRLWRQLRFTGSDLVELK
jgi:hypothetical protein